jgi:1-acyl-sn-glycerol-3-phosphate acyltransferase
LPVARCLLGTGNWQQVTYIMLRGIGVLVLLVLNLLVWGTPLVLLGIVKFAVHMTAPRSRLRTRVILALAWLAERWVRGNDRIFDRLLPTRWDVAGVGEEVRPDGHYLIISNHVSWVDIFVLFRAFHGRAPFIRFFLKHQLIWFPIVGQGCWALEFPFMHRYSPQYLEAHPEKRGMDLATTRRACQRYRNFPVAIANFVEGTRFTRQKRDAQQSPYRHLLRPRVGGVSFVFASLGDILDATYDVTIAYPRPEVTVWEFLTGDIGTIAVRARRVEMPPAEETRAWIEALWREKDDLLDSLM